jgi:hypothetical protein
LTSEVEGFAVRIVFPALCDPWWAFGMYLATVSSYKHAIRPSFDTHGGAFFILYFGPVKTAQLPLQERTRSFNQSAKTLSCDLFVFHDSFLEPIHTPSGQRNIHIGVLASLKITTPSNSQNITPR